MKYSLGLDIGSTSVGWTVGNLDRHRIEDLGVRCFNAAEVPKTRESLAKPRREARSARRRLRRRRGRLDRAKHLFVEYGLLSNPDTVFPERPGKDTPAPDPWRLRGEGLSRRLNGEEFGRALYHIAKHRGFKSNRKHEKPADSDSKKMLAGVEGIRRMVVEHGYRTVGEMIYSHGDFADRKRNRDREYSHTIARGMLEEELNALFEAQRRLGSALASTELQAEFLAEAFNWQKPFASGDEILNKVGLCTFEGKNGERRAARSSWTAERFDLLCKINKLQVVFNGDRTPLSNHQRRTVEQMAYGLDKVTYEQIRKKLKIPDEAKFAGVPLRYVKRKEGRLVEDMGCEESTFRQLTGYHSLRKVLGTAGVWNCVKDSPDLIDDLAFALTFYKTDADIRSCLTERGVSAAVVEAAAAAPTFSTVTNLSIKAMRNMIPHLETGLRYDQACAAAGYSHYNPKGGGERGLRLPAITRDQIGNPVVLRALSQAREVVNHIVARHGPPTYVNIELATDMGKSAKRRDEIRDRNEENRKAREEDNAHYRECFGADPKGEDRVKWRLYREQNGQCAYSQRCIDVKRLPEPGYVEIDHILPYSRSLDNRMSNRVLVHCKQNRDKGDRTPHEYLAGNPERWAAFEAWVKATTRDRDKRANLLTETFAARQDEWMQRSLTDTRYAASFFADLVRHHLKFADPEVKQPVRCLAGAVTALARGLWGLGRTRKEKVRLADDLHHALDAAVIAMLTPGRINFITEYSKAKETGRLTEISDEETGEVYEVFRDRPFEFPRPWKGFRKELLARLSENPAEGIKQLEVPSYEGVTGLRSVIVSRMPQRKATGAIHEETIRSAKLVDSERKSAVRKPLSKLKAKDLQNLVCKKTDPRLFQEMSTRMEEHGGNAEKAFAEPLHKPTNDGSPGPVVKSVKVCQPQYTGIKVRGGVADNGRMVRVEVSRKRDKRDRWQYFFTPVYVSHFMRRQLPAVPGEFMFSLYPYDLVRLGRRDEPYFGYYRKYNINTQSLTICDVNNAQLLRQSIGVRNLDVLEKYEMSVLGEYRRIEKEVRRGLANGGDLEPGETEARE